MAERCIICGQHFLRLDGRPAEHRIVRVVPSRWRDEVRIYPASVSDDPVLKRRRWANSVSSLAQVAGRVIETSIHAPCFSRVERISTGVLAEKGAGISILRNLSRIGL